MYYFRLHGCARAEPRCSIQSAFKASDTVLGGVDDVHKYDKVKTRLKRVARDGAACPLPLPHHCMKGEATRSVSDEAW
jgi:hypothetical protein